MAGAPLGVRLARNAETLSKAIHRMRLEGGSGGVEVAQQVQALHELGVKIAGIDRLHQTEGDLITTVTAFAKARVTPPGLFHRLGNHAAAMAPFLSSSQLVGVLTHFAHVRERHSAMLDAIVRMIDGSEGEELVPSFTLPQITHVVWVCQVLGVHGLSGVLGAQAEWHFRGRDPDDTSPFHVSHFVASMALLDRASPSLPAALSFVFSNLQKTPRPSTQPGMEPLPSFAEQLSASDIHRMVWGFVTAATPKAGDVLASLLRRLPLPVVLTPTEAGRLLWAVSKLDHKTHWVIPHLAPLAVQTHREGGMVLHALAALRQTPKLSELHAMLPRIPSTSKAILGVLVTYVVARYPADGPLASLLAKSSPNGPLTAALRCVQKMAVLQCRDHAERWAREATEGKGLPPETFALALQTFALLAWSHRTRRLGARVMTQTADMLPPEWPTGWGRHQFTIAAKGAGDWFAQGLPTPPPLRDAIASLLRAARPLLSPADVARCAPAYPLNEAECQAVAKAIADGPPLALNTLSRCMLALSSVGTLPEPLVPCCLKALKATDNVSCSTVARVVGSLAGVRADNLIALCLDVLSERRLKVALPRDLARLLVAFATSRHQPPRCIAHLLSSAGGASPDVHACRVVWAWARLRLPRRLLARCLRGPHSANIAPTHVEQTLWAMTVLRDPSLPLLPTIQRALRKFATPSDAVAVLRHLSRLRATDSSLVHLVTSSGDLHDLLAALAAGHTEECLVDRIVTLLSDPTTTTPTCTPSEAIALASVLRDVPSIRQRCTPLVLAEVPRMGTSDVVQLLRALKNATPNSIANAAGNRCLELLHEFTVEEALACLEMLRGCREGVWSSLLMHVAHHRHLTPRQAISAAWLVSRRPTSIVADVLLQRDYPSKVKEQLVDILS